jgi:seryl-tRNA synthetase
MIDIKLLREQPELVKENLKRRNDTQAIELLEEFLAIDRTWRNLKGQSDELRSKRNKLSAAINDAKKVGRDVQSILEEAKAIPGQLAAIEEELKSLEAQQKKLHLSIPNMLDEAVPDGVDESENVTLRTWGTIPKHTFELKPHGEIAEHLGSDFTYAAKVSGAGFYFLRGDLALLNQAIVRFAVDHLVKKAYTYTEPPLMLRRDAYEGVTDLGSFHDVLYKIEGEDLYLIATSEHPLTAQFMNENLHPDSFPLKLVGYSMCFRKEIGSKGVDTKGIFRTHQFNKVEQIIICRPEESKRYHEEMLVNNEEIFQALELPHRVITLCSGDTGKVSAKTYDTEVWMPRQQAYKEVCSSSNCTDYQARRLNIRFQDKDGSYKFVHTLNATAVATGRVLVAILENNQQKDGSVIIPHVLRQYMNGKVRLEPARHP